MIRDPSSTVLTRSGFDALSATRAVVFQEPGSVGLRDLDLISPSAEDVIVDVDFSGISTGTERLLWTGKMPPFPGLGYPLVPGYESVGRVRQAGRATSFQEGDLVFVPGANCFGDVKGLFGGTASRLVVPGARAVKINDSLAEQGTLLALAATAYHALRPQPDTQLPDLIVGHGVLGRLLARLTVALGADPPTVWETQADRRVTSLAYPVLDPAEDSDRQFSSIVDASGDSTILNSLIARLQRGGEVVLAGFYADPLSFDFPPAFMREARLRVAAEFLPQDFVDVLALLDKGSLSLDGLITHRLPAQQAQQGYETAFTEPDCLKMVLDWKGEHQC